MRYALAVSLVVAVSAATSPSASSAASLEGSWSGGGVVTLKSGHKEAVRCRVRYSKGAGRTFELSATCASTAGTIKQWGRVVQLKGGNRYTGRLRNKAYNVSGNIVVTVRGRRQTVTMTSSKGSGRLSLSKR